MTFNPKRWPIDNGTTRQRRFSNGPGYFRQFNDGIDGKTFDYVVTPSNGLKPMPSDKSGIFQWQLFEQKVKPLNEEGPNTNTKSFPSASCPGDAECC
jgi:hypothetical protein